MYLLLLKRNDTRSVTPEINQLASAETLVEILEEMKTYILKGIEFESLKIVREIDVSYRLEFDLEDKAQIMATDAQIQPSRSLVTINKIDIREMADKKIKKEQYKEFAEYCKNDLEQSKRLVLRTKLNTKGDR